MMENTRTRSTIKYKAEMMPVCEVIVIGQGPSEGSRADLAWGRKSDDLTRGRASKLRGGEGSNCIPRANKSSDNASKRTGREVDRRQCFDKSYPKRVRR